MPEPAPLPPKPAPDMVKALGAESLSEFFAKTPGPGPIEPAPPLFSLPKGPDDIQAAIAAVTRRQAQLSREIGSAAAAGSPEGRRLEISAKGLRRAWQLLSQLKARSEEWPKALRALRDEAANLQRAVEILARAPAAPGGDPDPATEAVALTSLSSSLREGLISQKRLLSKRLDWRNRIRELAGELESLSAAASEATSDRGWRPLLARLRTRWEALRDSREELDRTLTESARVLRRDLQRLEDVEREVAGGYEHSRRERGEILMGQVKVLWGAVCRRRQELARCWRELPALVGRPGFLDKTFLYSAVLIGRIQTMAEEMSLALESFNSRRSGTCAIREAARVALGVDVRDQKGPGLLSKARQRLDELDRQIERVRLRAEGASSRRVPAGQPAAPRPAPPAGQARADKDLAGQARADHDLSDQDLYDHDRYDHDLSDHGLSDHDLPDQDLADQDLAEGADEIETLEPGHRHLDEDDLPDPLDDDYLEAPGKDPELERGLLAVDSERRRLSESLAEVRSELRDSARGKMDVLKSLREAEEALRVAADERERLTAEARRAAADLATLKRRDERLSELYRRERSALKELEERHQALTKARRLDRQALLGYQADRQRLGASLKARDDEIKSVALERAELARKEAELNNELDEIKAREAGLVVELGGRDEELKEADRIRRRLGKVLTGYRSELDRLMVARAALLTSWRRRGRALTAGEAERDQLREGLDKRQRELVEVATKRRALMAELGDMRLRLSSISGERTSLAEELERLRREAGARAEAQGGLEREREALMAELERLKLEAAAGADARVRLEAAQEAARREIDEDLKPLVQALALALWRSEAYLKVVQEGVEAKLEAERQAARAREADIRVNAAVKEIDQLELISAKNQELEALKEERDSLSADLAEAARAAGAGEEELVKRSWLAHQLSMALSTTNLRNERLRRGLKDIRSRFDQQREQAKAIKEELEALVQNQARALSDHQGWLAQLAPLVSDLVRSGADVWRAAGPDEARDAVVFFMTRENAQLAEELGGLRAERQGLHAERREYQDLYERMRRRLAELKPLVEFLAVKLARTCEDLARALTERDALRADVKALVAAGEKALPAPAPEALDAAGGATGEAAAGEAAVAVASEAADKARAETARARHQVARLTLENQSLGEAAQKALRDLEDRARSLHSLQTEKDALASKLAERERDLADSRQSLINLEGDKAKLLASMERQGVDLTLARAEAGRLALERDQLKSEAEQRATELGVLQERLTELRERPREDGRLESAWAAITYLSSKAGDAMSNLQGKLERQTRELDASLEELKRKDAEIKRLEERQDNLSTLYWTMLTLAVDAPAGLGGPEDAETSALTMDAGEDSGVIDVEVSDARDLDSGELEDSVELDDSGEPRAPGAGSGEPRDPGAGSGETGAFGAGSGEPRTSCAGSGEARASGDGSGEAGASGAPAGTLVEAPPETQKSPDGPAAVGAAGAAGGQDPADSAETDPGQSQDEPKRGGALLSDLRKAARRGLLSLFMTGGVVLAMPGLIGAEESDGPLELGGPDTPMILDYRPDPGPPPLTRWRSSYLGRTLELEPGVLAGGFSGPASRHPLVASTDLDAPAPGASLQGVPMGADNLAADPGPAVFRPAAPLLGAFSPAPERLAGISRPIPEGLQSARRPTPDGLQRAGRLSSEGLSLGFPPSDPLDPLVTFEPPVPPAFDSSVIVIGSGPPPFEEAFSRPLAPPVASLASRGAGVEDRVRSLVETQAARWGQSPEDWLTLIRRAFGPETTVSLAALGGADAPTMLLRRDMPNLAPALRPIPSIGRNLPGLLAAVAALGPGEPAWWDRVYGLMRARLRDDAQAVEALVLRLARSGARSLPAVEFGGGMRPFRILENIPPERASERLAVHLAEDWGRTKPRRKTPKGGEPARLAADLVHTAKNRRIPRTLLTTWIHHDFAAHGAWPDTLALLARADRLAWEIQRSLVVWSPDKPPLCDFDNLAARVLKDSENPAGLERAYLSLQERLASDQARGVSLL